MVVRLNPVEFAKAMMKKKKQLIPTPIVLDNGIAGIVYGYYVGDDFYYLDRLDVDVSKKEELRKIKKYLHGHVFTLHFSCKGHEKRVHREDALSIILPV